MRNFAPKPRFQKVHFIYFFVSKELLFCAVSDEIQKRQKNLIEETLSKSPNKDDICRMLKQLYAEFIPFAYPKVRYDNHFIDP